MEEGKTENFTGSGNSTTNSICWRIMGDFTTKRLRWCVLVAFNIAAITTSMLTIYSCNFFSYYELDVFNDAYTSTAEISYEPFEYLPKAGVGLFKYYMGDPSGKGVMMSDRMCYYYCDEYTDYQWLSSNIRETGHGNLDIWVVARYCSILAPIAGLLAFLQLLFEIAFGSRMSQYGDNVLYFWMFLKAQMFTIAAFLQLGTFLVLFAPSIMYSTSAEDQIQQFCFSATSTVQCSMDTGSMFSLASVFLYLSLASWTFFSWWCPSSNASDTKRDAEPDTDDSQPESDDSQPESDLSHSESDGSQDILFDIKFTSKDVECDTERDVKLDFDRVFERYLELDANLNNVCPVNYKNYSEEERDIHDRYETGNASEYNR